MNIHHIVQYNKMIHKFTCSIYNDTFFFFMKKILWNFNIGHLSDVNFIGCLT